MIVLGVDVETTGLDADADEVTEIGAVLWDTETSRPMGMMSRTIQINRALSPEIKELTGMTDDMVAAPYADPADFVWGDFGEHAALAEMFVAHNAEFDRKFIEKACKKYGVELPGLPWIDTAQDIAFPAKMKSRGLVALCAEHGFLNPFPHRAVTDVLAMLKLMGMYPFEKIHERSLQPTLRVQALVSYEDRELARTRGFYWDAKGKVWFRNMKAGDYRKEDYAFSTKIIAGGESQSVTG